MVFTDPAPTPFWYAVSRLGEAQVMLPAAAATLCWLALRAEGRPLVRWWLLALTAAAALTTATKVAFIGYGWGSATFDFTGISGHAMFAAAVYPLLFRVLVAARSPSWQRAAVAVGVLLALVVGWSRLAVAAHSMSEVVAGSLIGLAASSSAMALARLPALRLPIWLPFAVVVLLLGQGTLAPPSRTHDMVTRLSLALSGRNLPYTRSDLLRRAAESHRSGTLPGAPLPWTPPAQRVLLPPG